jgi:hypothetical protein
LIVVGVEGEGGNIGAFVGGGVGFKVGAFVGGGDVEMHVCPLPTRRKVALVARIVELELKKEDPRLKRAW